MHLSIEAETEAAAEVKAEAEATADAQARTTYELTSKQWHHEQHRKKYAARKAKQITNAPGNMYLLDIFS